MKQTRVAIVSQHDTLWSLYAWNNALPILSKQDNIELAGFWVCEEKFMNVPANKVLNWYLKTFGALNFFNLARFKIRFSIATTLKSFSSGYCKSFEKLSNTYHIPYYTIASPNNKELSDWVKKNEIDILVIMVGHILKGEILTAPSNCIINKHAALLPANKGVFPYFWAKLKGEPQGISFHKVTAKIDEGDILYQEKVEDKHWLSSMIAFYFHTYKNYGKMLSEAINNAIKNKAITPDESLIPSYHGGPTHEDYKNFRQAGGKIIRLMDLLLPFSL